MLPILGCEQRKKQFLDHFIFAQNENESYKKDIDQLTKTLKIASNGSDMERNFLCKSGGNSDPRTLTRLALSNIFGEEYLNISGEIMSPIMYFPLKNN